MLAASLGLIALLGPSATDMYLASMPDISNEFSTDYANVQLTLTVYLLAMGAGQLLFGPITDAFGRRTPLLTGIAVFVLSSMLAASAGSLEVLLLARFLQGLAAALTLVVVMSTVRDVAEGTAAARLFSLLMTIEGLAPVLAPAVGGVIDVHFGWRAVMLALAVLGSLALANSWLSLPESLHRENRLPLQPLSVAKTYARIGKDAQFLLPTLALSAAFFFLFLYIGGAAHVYQSRFGLSPDTFGFVFGATGLSVLLGAICTGRFVGSIGVARMSILGAVAIALGSLVALVFALSVPSLTGVVVGMFIALWGLGVAEATFMAMAMGSQKTALGSTAALLGGIQLVIASAATPLSGGLATWGTVPWLSAMVVVGCVVVTLALMNARQAPDMHVLPSH